MGFMNYLNDIDNIMTDDTEEVVEEVIVVEEQTVVTPKRNKKVVAPVSKDATVELLEYRLKDKLDSVGLNEAVIRDVIGYVLGDVGSVSDPITPKQPKQPQAPVMEQVVETSPQPQSQSPVQEKNVSLADHAGSILEGVPEAQGTSSQSMMAETQQPASVDMSNVADHASALL